MKDRYGKIILLAGLFFALWLGVRYLLPLFFPFLLGAVLALAAEPMTAFFCRRLRLPRGVAVGISVSATFCFFFLVLLLLGALIVRELGILAGALPDLGETARAGLATLSDWLLSLARRAPAGLRTYLLDSITELFSGSTALLDRAAGYVLNLAGTVLSHIPDSALSIGTAIISGYMISAKLPAIRARWQRLSGNKLSAVVRGFRQIKQTICGWLLAQLKLSGITWGIVTLGFVILRVPYAPLWAVLVALVDAFPILGTGTVLIPWSIVSFLQADNGRAIGLVGIYAVVALTRSALEPRLVGRQLGIDPLVTLFALYAGYKLWGLAGMLLAPILTVAATQLLNTGPSAQ